MTSREQIEAASKEEVLRLLGRVAAKLRERAERRSADPVHEKRRERLLDPDRVLNRRVERIEIGAREEMGQEFCRERRHAGGNIRDRVVAKLDRGRLGLVEPRRRTEACGCRHRPRCIQDEDRLRIRPDPAPGVRA